MPDKLLVVKLFNKIAVSLKQLPNAASTFQMNQAIQVPTNFLKQKLEQLFNIPMLFLLCLKASKTTIKRIFWDKSDTTEEKTELSIDLDMKDFFKGNFMTVNNATLNIKTNKKILKE